MAEVTVEIDIEDAIEDAINSIDMSDYIDHDDIRYDIEGDILDQVNDYICHDSIRYEMEGYFADDDEFQSLSSDVQELQEQMKKLLEVINLPEDPPQHDIYFDMQHIVPLDKLRDVYQERREARWATIRYMSKPELVAWAEKHDYDVDDMTVKQIHELVL